jgi:site-specific recombinase XerD
VAVRRLAYEAADTGLLSPELAAGIRRVKGAKRIGVRLGNWLSADQVKLLMTAPNADAMRGKRDHAIIAILVGCGLRRSEVAELKFGDIQQRDECWVILDP